MRLLLINPPYPYEESPSPPLGLAYLASYLLNEGHDIKIADFVINPYSFTVLEKIIRDFKPNAVGATAVTMNVKRAISILENCRSIAPSTPIIMGGPHVTFDAQDILSNNRHIDFIVRSEGELTLSELLMGVQGKISIEQIKGLSYRKNGSILHNEDRPFMPDINILPMPARHLIELSKYKAIGFPVTMTTSRGCPFDCIFCVGSRMVGRRVRYFDTMRVVDEFESLAGLGFKQINIADDLFTSNKERCIAICNEILKRGINHTWTAFARVNTVTLELLSEMKKAGCTTVCFGIESGNQRILDIIKKKISIDMAKRAVAMCNEAGIVPMTSYILGLPGETPQSVKETMEVAASLSPCYGYHILSPFPGTDVRERAAEYGLRIMTNDWDCYDANRSVCDSDSMPYSEIDRTYNEFNGAIEKYIRGAAVKFENGEPLSDHDHDMVKNIKSFEFVRDLLKCGAIEAFCHTDDGKDEAIDRLSRYIADLNGRDAKFCKSELMRLVSSNCLSITNADGKIKISWNST